MKSPPPVGVSAAGGDGRVLRRCDGRYVLMIMHSFILFALFYFYLHSFTSICKENLPSG